MLHQVQIKLDQFETESINRAPLPEAIDPRQDISDARLEGRREPALSTGPIGEAGFAITSMPLAAGPPTGSPLVESFFNLLTPMRQFRCPHHLAGAIVDHSDPR